MNQPNSIRRKGAPHLSVIHKAPIPGEGLFHFQDAVIQTDFDFNVTGWNATAEQLYGLPGAMGQPLFDLVNLEFVNGSFEVMKKDLSLHHWWNGEVIFKRFDGELIHLLSSVTYIINEKEEPVAIMIVCHNINDIKKKERQLADAEKKYETLVNTLFDGVMMVLPDGRIGACNKRAAEILGSSENELLGKVAGYPGWKAIREDHSAFPVEEFPAAICLRTGESQRNIVMGLEQVGGRRLWLLVNCQALFHSGEASPYAAVVSFSDITNKLRSEEELQKSNERFYYAGRVSSDAIWDVDLETNEIYRSEAFNHFSGYSIESIKPNLDWWFDKVHPDDRERVRNKVNESIAKGIAQWQDEYRFQCANGEYKYLLDRGIILYKQGKPSRIIGAIQDLTERKELEARLLEEELQKQRQVNQATIVAQEQERNNIGKELHDNVNQILMSAKLFINAAQKTPAQSKDLLERAVEYQLLALDEIRKLSKSLSTSLVKMVGLKDSVEDIVINMKELQHLDVKFTYNSRVETKLTGDQKLMVYRIIQEQTSNITRHADARSVQILINETKGILHLVISDDGKGFEPGKKPKGIGFINIFSRADAYNGTVSIISSPGNGCMLELRFPVNG